MQHAVRARRIVTPEGERSGVVVIRDGVIASVEDTADPGTAVFDVPDDCVLLPGLVDSHVHVNEPGRTEWEGFATATRAAAAGGITTIVDMPLNSIPPTVDVSALRTKQDAARGRVHVDVGFWGGAIPGNTADLEPLHRAGVVGVKCFLLPSGVDEFPPLDPPGLRAALQQIADIDGLLIAHCEDESLVHQAVGTRYADFVSSRPDASELRAIELLLDAARDTGARVHIVHLSSATAIPLLRAAKADGVHVSVETCPHYLTLSAEQVPDGATEFKCCPPIRGEANREQLWQALADGVIDCVVSDHSPCTPELKRLDVGDFGAAWGGIASVQLALPAMWTEASARGFAPSDIARWMAAAPARLTGLDTKGAIAAGFDADLVVFAPAEQFTVDPAALQHRNPITPYAGAVLTGVVRRTLLAGESIDPATPRGRLLSRRPAVGARP